MTLGTLILLGLVVGEVVTIVKKVLQLKGVT